MGAEYMGQHHHSPALQPAKMSAPKAFTDEQIARYKKMFDDLDLNKDGLLEPEELAALSKGLGYRLPKDQVLALLVSLDSNKEGLNFNQFLGAMPGSDKIPEDEHKKAEYRQKFQEYDKDGNGFISPEEAQAVLTKDLGFNEQKTKTLVDQYDTNKDGQLSYEEFVSFYLKVKESKDNMTKVFKGFDKENKGYVSIDDAKRILGGLMFDVSEIEGLIKAHDTNGDGKMQYEEFVD